MNTQSIRREFGDTIIDMSNDMEVSPRTICRWDIGAQQPNPKHLYALNVLNRMAIRHRNRRLNDVTFAERIRCWWLRLWLWLRCHVPRQRFCNRVLVWRRKPMSTPFENYTSQLVRAIRDDLKLGDEALVRRGWLPKEFIEKNKYWKGDENE